LLVVLAYSQAGPGGGQGHSWWIDWIVLALVLIAAFVGWLVTRWRVYGSEFQLETGLIRRQSIRVPLARVQAIDVVRPVLARFFSLAELRVVVAGRGSAKARLAYLREREALALRAQLLALAHGLEADTPEPTGQRFFELDNARLVGSVVVLGWSVTGVLAMAAVVALIVWSPAGAALIGLLITTILVFVQLGFRRINTEFDLSLAEAADGLRVESGLLQTRAETIPFGRIQAARFVQPILWRPFGWCRLEIDVARQGGKGRSEEDDRGVSRAILPVGTIEEGRVLLARVLPGADIEIPRGSRCPARARFKAPLSFHNLASWHKERYMYSRTGRLRREIVVLPLDKAQSLRRAQGPLQRRLRLATVYVDSAGRSWRASARSRDESDAEKWLYELVDVARYARQTMSRKGT
jgi:putative membrane protein